MKQKKLLVIGGGAAGFFCAVNAARLYPSLEVIIVEKLNKVLSKVKVSGGGRCNVTHACFSIEEMIKNYPRGSQFVKKTFHHFFTNDTINWFKERGVELKTEPDGRMFPNSNSSQTIIDCLLKEGNRYGVQLLLNREVHDLRQVEGKWNLGFKNGDTHIADFVCIACGGYAKLLQFEWMQHTCHSVESPVPSLFTFNLPGNALTTLTGVSVENALVKIADTKLSQTGPLLITHWGLSGPSVLILSAWGAKELSQRKYHFSIVINWIPKYNENNLRSFLQQFRFEKAAQFIVSKNPFQLPQRLWEYLLKQSGISEEKRWADLPVYEQNKLIKNLTAQEHTVSGKTTFKEEFVTAGGIRLNEIDSSTMQSKIVTGLFFAGEILDVDGVTGGFNFQHAWTTGWIAANGLSKLI